MDTNDLLLFLKDLFDDDTLYIIKSETIKQVHDLKQLLIYDEDRTISFKKTFGENYTSYFDKIFSVYIRSIKHPRLKLDMNLNYAFMVCDHPQKNWYQYAIYMYMNKYKLKYGLEILTINDTIYLKKGF